MFCWIGLCHLHLELGSGCFVSDLNLSDAMCVLAGARSNKIWLKSFSVPAAVPEEVVEVSAETKAAEDSGGYVQAGGCPAAIGCNGHFKNLSTHVGFLLPNPYNRLLESHTTIKD
ncbi:hypothetical protein H4Q26_013459 [Puccinia striiformis f. sp. tritici PST-130]|nr:hypothetical protein H4Q26_013459 [Puccinia striiformis f. sp. tritici PST-130]